MRTLPVSRVMLLALGCGALLGALAEAAPQPAARPGIQPAVPPAGPVRDSGGRGPAAPSKTGTSTLAGTVSIASGQPASGARVMISSPDGPPRTTMTDNQGRFSFSGLAAGRYNVSVTKPGHVNVTYGQRRPNSAGTPIPLGDADKRVIALQLPRGGVITGMILDERGEPAINANVRGMRSTMVMGQRRTQQMAMDTTDDRGIYRLHSLQPGEYAVCASARNLGPQNDTQRAQMEIDSVRRMIENAPAGQRQGLTARLSQLQAQLPEQPEPVSGYAPVCFPGSAAAGTTTIPVAAGDERVGIDLQLLLTPVARLEGTVVAPGGASPRNVQLTLSNAEESIAEVERQFARVEDSGRFFFQNIPPGRFTLSARSMPMGPMGNPLPPPGGGPAPAPEPRLWATADVVLAGQDLTGVVLELQRGVTISGQLVFQPTTLQPPGDLSRAQVSMFPHLPDFTGMQMGGNSQATVDAAGRFTISDVVPGKYRFAAGIIGVQGWHLDAVTVGGQDALDFPLEVKASRAVSGVVVTLVDRIAELSGSVVNEKGQPATEHTLLLYPADPKYWTPQSRRIRVTRAGADGKYVFRAIPPGEYRMTTLLDPEPNSWYDRDMLEQLDSSSSRVNLAEGEKKLEHVRVRTGG